MTLFEWIIVVMLVLFGIPRVADFLAHYNRYRNYLNDYPATRRDKGRVWRHTA
jgi:hypothetical protein